MPCRGRRLGERWAAGLVLFFVAAAAAGVEDAGAGNVAYALVVATRHTTETLRLLAHVTRLQRASLRALRAAAGNASSVAAVLVDNASPAAGAVRKAAHVAGMVYARNDDAVDNGFGYELGAWRWAVAHVLPKVGLAEDAVVYLVQDTLFLAGKSGVVPYPPPEGFRGTRVYHFEAGPYWHRQNWEPALKDAARKLGLDEPAPVPDPPAVAGFKGCFGPNLVLRWSEARALRDRGFFDMLRAGDKDDEQRTERVIGWALKELLGDDGSLCGHFRDSLWATNPRGHPKEAAPCFRKEYGSGVRSG